MVASKGDQYLSSKNFHFSGADIFFLVFSFSFPFFESIQSMLDVLTSSANMCMGISWYRVLLLLEQAK